MTKTLADMTPQEREECVGMWCSYNNGIGTQCAVLAMPDMKNTYMGEERTAKLIMPHMKGIAIYRHWSSITPRHDLPRAWQPDGTPPKGEWAEVNMEDAWTLPMENPTHRRWQGQWEELPNA